MSFDLVFLTSLTMIAFAANSVFCRIVLVDSANDPVSFTLIRLASGALMLSFFFIKFRKSETFEWTKKTFLAPAMLFSYALFFSLAYVQIGAGTGALILFASVQLTMMFVVIFRGQKLNGKEKIGFLLAAFGFIYLLLPGLHMPSPIAAALMCIAGISWGVYSLLGQGLAKPILATARNFLLTIPLIILIMLFNPIKLTSQGLIFAILSGSLTSGLGYVLWYVALKKLPTSTAAIVQLSVPAIAAFGGVMLLNESLSLRMIVSSFLIFSGIFIKVKAARAIK